MPKRSLRQQMLARRRALAETDVRLAGTLAQQALISTREFVDARVIGLYVPVHNEVETAEVMRVALAVAKLVLLPAVCPGGLEFRQIDDTGVLRSGAFNIPEPDASCQVHSPEEADLIVIPGVAFDTGGRRIGYGKGFYDRALHRLEGKGRLVGFCYDFQIVDELPGEPHDVRMDMIVTEQRVIHPLD